VLADAKVGGTYDQYTAASAGIVRLVMLNEVQGLLLGHHVDVAHPVLVCHTIYLSATLAISGRNVVAMNCVSAMSARRRIISGIKLKESNSSRSFYCFKDTKKRH